MGRILQRPIQLRRNRELTVDIFGGMKSFQLFFTPGCEWVVLLRNLFEHGHHVTSLCAWNSRRLLLDSRRLKSYGQLPQPGVHSRGPQPAKGGTEFSLRGARAWG